MKLEQLITLYLEAQATPQQEQELRQRLQQGEPLPRELEPLRTLVCADAGLLPAPLQPEAILATPDASPLFDAVVKQRRRRRLGRMVSLVASVAAAVVVVALVLGGNDSSEPEQPVASVADSSVTTTPAPVAQNETLETSRHSVPSAAASRRSAPSAPRALAAKNAPSVRGDARHTLAAAATATQSSGGVEGKGSAGAPSASLSEVAAAQQPLNEGGEAAEHIETRINRHRHLGAAPVEAFVVMQ